MKKLAVFAVAAVLAASAFGAGWYLDGDLNQTGITIGGKTTDVTGWTTDFNQPAQLGTLADLTITDLSFSIWADSLNDSGMTAGCNLYFLLFDGQGKIGETNWEGDGLWAGHGTWVDGKDNHNWAESWTGSYDVLADSGMSGVTLEEGKDYQIQVYAKTYGNGNEYISGDNGSNYNAKFTYSTQSPAVPEPATMSLLGLGALAMVLRRKLRK